MIIKVIQGFEDPAIISGIRNEKGFILFTDQLGIICKLIHLTGGGLEKLKQKKINISRYQTHIGAILIIFERKGVENIR